MFKCSEVLVAVLLLATTGASLPAGQSEKGLLQQLYDWWETLPHSLADEECIRKNCKEFAATCNEDPNCLKAICCTIGCLAGWDVDVTPQKYMVQNCTNKCVYTYGEDDVYPATIGCYTDNKCISLQPIPSTCKASNMTPLKQLTTKDLEGKWWVVRGYNKLYDCYPCHTESFSPTSDETSWLYHPVYDTYLVNGELKPVTTPEVWPNTHPGESIKYFYRNLGILTNEERWLLDKAADNSWVIVYYCGNTLEWNYEGAQVLSRNKSLDSFTYRQIATSYEKAAGLNLQEFCYVNNYIDHCLN